MSYTVEKLEKSQVKFSFDIDADTFEKAVAAAYNKTKHKYSVPGFRKGHVPRKVIEGMYGKEVFFEDAMDIVIPEAYSEALDKEHDIEAVATPELESFDMKEDGGVTFVLKVTVRPEVKLGKYKGLSVERKVDKVTAKQVDEEVENAREKQARIVDVDRAAKKGDIVNIDFAGSVDGVKFDGGSAEAYDLTLGSGSFIPGFEDQLVGAKAGEERAVKVTFPEDYHADALAGKEAVFECKVNKVSVKVVPEPSDEWAKDVSEYETLAEYRDSVKKRMEEQNDRRAKSEKENAVINAIADASEADIPEAMVSAYLDDMLRDLSFNLYYRGMTTEDYFKYMGTTEEEYRKENHDKALRGALTRLCLEEIVKRENITATDEEAEKKYLDSQPEPEDGKEKRKPDEKELSYLKDEIVMDKLLSMLVSSAVTE